MTQTEASDEGSRPRDKLQDKLDDCSKSLFFLQQRAGKERLTSLNRFIQYLISVMMKGCVRFGAIMCAIKPFWTVIKSKLLDSINSESEAERILYINWRLTRSVEIFWNEAFAALTLNKSALINSPAWAAEFKCTLCVAFLSPSSFVAWKSINESSSFLSRTLWKLFGDDALSPTCDERCQGQWQ